MEFSAVQWLVLVISLNQVSKTKSSFISAGGLIMFQLVYSEESQGIGCVVAVIVVEIFV